MSNLQTISSLSIAFMSVSAFLAIIVPITLIIFMGVRKRMNWKAMFFGVLLFVVFALVLERIMHFLVLGSNLTENPIYKNPILFMLYGGFAAGIFEETARFLGFKFLIKVRDGESLDTGISYGLGHGGIEAVLLGGMVSVSNLLTSVMWNGGLLKGATAAMNEQQLANFNVGMNALITTPSHIFLLTGIERMIALMFQIALSLFVFKAVVEKKWQYFVYAILIHAGVDMIAVLVQRGYIKDLYLFEGLCLIITLVVLAVAFRINKRGKTEKQIVIEQETASQGPDGKPE